MLSLAFDFPHDRDRETLSELLGGKGAGLAMMAGELGLPVPPGFTLTTEACARYRSEGWSSELDEALRGGLSALESEIGRRLGDGNAPLLVSVRSGAPVSMPGMMDTVLNVGLNGASLSALRREDEAFARDCRVRLEQSFAQSVGGEPPDDVWQQLRLAVEAVFRSADSERARSYRRREGLTGEPTTAVNIQTMVFGNRDDRSGTGVVFSRDPATGEPRLYGDVLFRAQGEDVVSGRHPTLPVSALASRMPDVAARLHETAERLERQLRDLCEIEFTIERERLWILQVRSGKRSPRAALRIAAALAEDPAFPLERPEAVERVAALLADPPRIESVVGANGGPLPSPLAEGLGASPGIACGEIVTRVSHAVEAAAAGHDVILCRPETSPSDVEGMQVARGLLTARGGLASHAAVVARGWGIPAVVGVRDLEIDEQGITLGGRRLGVGDPIALDGGSGAIWAGAVERREERAPEVDRLIGWARELAIAIPGPATPDIRESLATPIPADVEPQDVIRMLSIRGSALPDAIAAGLAVETEAIAALLDRLGAEDLVAPAKPIGLGLTETGQLRGRELLAADRAALGPAAAERALEAFQPLDERVKHAVTDWQLRSVAGELVPNDHSDADWDQAVFDRLARILPEVEAWLDPLVAALPRLSRYAQRLETAFDHASAGDARFVASPRVDSLHGVWFELHEDLIRLAGSSRAEELAAGRAG